MLVEVRPTGRLRGKNPVDVTAALDPVVRALCEFGTGGGSGTELDLSRVRVVCCLLYTSPSPRDKRQSRMPSSA